MQDKGPVLDVIAQNASITSRRESLLSVNRFQFRDRKGSSANEARQTRFSDATIIKRKAPLPVGLVQYPRQHVFATQKSGQTPVQLPQPLFKDAAISKRKLPLHVDHVQYPDQHVPVANQAPLTLFTDEERQDSQLKVRKLQRDIMGMDGDRRGVFQQLLHCSHAYVQQRERVMCMDGDCPSVFHVRAAIVDPSRARSWSYSRTAHKESRGGTHSASSGWNHGAVDLRPPFIRAGDTRFTEFEKKKRVYFCDNCGEERKYKSAAQEFEGCYLVFQGIKKHGFNKFEDMERAYRSGVDMTWWCRACQRKRQRNENLDSMPYTELATRTLVHRWSRTAWHIVGAGLHGVV